MPEPEPEQEQHTDAPAPPGASGVDPMATLERLGLLALGVADLALDQLRQASAQVQAVTRRSDLRELLTDGVTDLLARGELASRRLTQGSDNYLELMARRAIERADATHG